MPRLVFVTGTSPDVREGSGTFVGISVLAAALSAAGQEIELLAPRPGRGPVSLARRLAFNAAARRRIARDTRPADAVVGFDLDGVFVRPPRGARYAVAIKGGIADEARFERGAARLRLGFESLLERRNARRADVVIAPSRYSARRIEEDYEVSADRIRVVPEPIDLARWEAARSRLPVTASRFPSASSILCVAHLYPRKDVPTLVEAVAAIPDARLRVAGDGPERPRLERLVARLGLGARVDLLGHVPFEELAAEFARAAVFCLPSRQEGFGIVFLEAMAAGIPIVAANAAAVPETVGDDGACAVLVPPGDAGSLAGALARLLADPALRTRMGAAGRERVRACDAPLVARRFLEALALAAQGS